jgi:hypothetical protein
MKEIAIQKISNDTLRCFSEEDVDQIADFPLNKILKAKVTGALKPRSYEQLQTFWCCCKTLCENSEDPNHATKDLVAEWVKVKLKYIDSWMVIDNIVHIKTKSISYKTLPHMMACNLFDRAFDLIAKTLGITRDELLANAKHGG